MKRDIGKAVYTIELQGAGKALQDLYSLDRAAQKVGKSFQSAMGGSRFNKTGGGGSRPSSGGGNVVERMLASRLPGQGMVNVPSLINDRQIKAIEKALADRTRTFSDKQRQKLEDALRMLKSNSNVTGATIESLNSFIRTFDELRNAPTQRLRELRAQMDAAIARDPGFKKTSAGQQLAFNIRSEEQQQMFSGQLENIGRNPAGQIKEFLGNVSGFAGGVASNARMAGILPFAAELSSAVRLSGDAEKAMARYQNAVGNAAKVERILNDLVQERLTDKEREHDLIKQITEAEIQRRQSMKMSAMSAEERTAFQERVKGVLTEQGPMFGPEEDVGTPAQRAARFVSGFNAGLASDAMSKYVQAVHDARNGVGSLMDAMMQYQLAERSLPEAMHMANRIYQDRIGFYQQIKTVAEQVVQIENARRRGQGLPEMTAQESANLRSTAEVQQAASMVPLIQQQAQYQRQLENVSAALARVQEEQAKVTAAGGIGNEARELEVAEASLEKQANDLRQLNTLYDQLNEAVIQLTNAQKLAASNPGSKELARGLKEAEAAYLDARHRVNELRFAVNNADNDLRTTAKGAKNAGFAMIQASYGAQDFIQVLAGGGGLQYALLASANNMSQVIVASESLSKSLGSVGVPLLAFGVTAGMLAIGHWFGATKTEADKLSDSVDRLSRSFDLMQNRFLAGATFSVPSLAASSALAAGAGYAESLFQSRGTTRIAGMRLGAIASVAGRNPRGGMLGTTVEDRLIASQESSRILASVQSMGATGNIQGILDASVAVRDNKAFSKEASEELANAIDEYANAIADSANSAAAFSRMINILTNNTNPAAVTAAMEGFDEAGRFLNQVTDRIKEELRRPLSAKDRADLLAAQAGVPAVARQIKIAAMESERGAPLQRLELETLDDFRVRAQADLAAREQQLVTRRAAATDPSVRAAIDAAIQRVQTQQAMLGANVTQQQANMQARAALGARNDILGLEIQGIQERAQQEREAAQRDLSGQARTQAIADINAAEAAAIDRASKAFANRQQDTLAGFQGQILGAMGTPEARMGAEDLNLVGQFREIQSMLDAGLVDATMAQDMLDMATAVSEQRKKDIEFENKKAGFSDIGSLWKQIQMSLKPDKSTQLQQQSVNILTAIQNRLAQGLSLTIP